jgi:hypothetical protein
MGGWRLEVGRMVAYIALPIVCFYLFNKPEYFKEYVAKNKQYYLIKEDRESVCLHVLICYLNLLFTFLNLFSKD